MQDGKLTLTAFEADIANFVRRILPDVTNSATSLPPKGENLGPCPKCNKGVIVLSAKAAGCHRWREGCTFAVWRQQFGKELSERQIKDLLANRKTDLIKGFKKKDGSGTYDARLVINNEFKVRLDFSNSPQTA